MMHRRGTIAAPRCGWVPATSPPSSSAGVPTRGRRYVPRAAPRAKPTARTLHATANLPAVSRRGGLTAMLTATGADVPGCGRTLGPVKSYVLKSDTDPGEPRRTSAGRPLNPKVPGSSPGAGTTAIAARVAKLLLNSVLGAKTEG